MCTCLDTFRDREYEVPAHISRMDSLVSITFRVNLCDEHKSNGHFSRIRSLCRVMRNYEQQNTSNALALSDLY